MKKSEDDPSKDDFFTYPSSSHQTFLEQPVEWINVSPSDIAHGLSFEQAGEESSSRRSTYWNGPIFSVECSCQIFKRFVLLTRRSGCDSSRGILSILFTHFWRIRSRSEEEVRTGHGGTGKPFVYIHEISQLPPDWLLQSSNQQVRS